MDAAIKTGRNTGKQIQFRQRTVQVLQVIIQARSNLKMYPAFISEKTGLISKYVITSAANAQQSAGAAVELDKQSSKLKKMTEGFKV